MAKALQCPACGTKRMVDTLQGVDSFPCATCGKVLKVPPTLSAPGAAAAAAQPLLPAPDREAGRAPTREDGGAQPLLPAPDREAGRAPTREDGGAQPLLPAPDREAGRAPTREVVASSAAPGAVPPPPRRRRRGANGADSPAPASPAPVAAAAAGTAAVAAPLDGGSTAPVSAVPAVPAPSVAPAAATAVAAGAATAGRRMVSSASPAATAVVPQTEDDAPAPRSAARRKRAPRTAAPDELPVVVRILIWVVALPLGLALVGIPARKAGYLSSQKLLDVVIKHNLDRFFPLAVIVLLWALVTAIIVHLFAEGGRRWLHRRRTAEDAAKRPTVVSSVPGAAPPPRRRTAANGDEDGDAQPRSRAASRGGS